MTAPRKEITFALNGEVVAVAGEEASLSLSDYLRLHQRLTGTKVVCAEGDCGACTVLVAHHPLSLPFTYQPVDSCIKFVYQLDGCHVVTVEGLGNDDHLHPVQTAMVNHFGSQCGFCTPGFVCAITGLAEASKDRRTQLDKKTLKRGLSGNLCRCTGYQQIIEAGRSVDLKSLAPLATRYNESAILDALKLCASSAAVETGDHATYLPSNLSEAVTLRTKHPNAIPVAGATDLGVQHNKGKLPPGNRIVLSGVREMNTIEQNKDRFIIGAAVNWQRVRETLATDYECFDELLDLFGAPQIRNAGTVGGNIMNASPIADSVPFFLVTDTVLTVAGPNGLREIAMCDFYTGYKQTKLHNNELLLNVKIPRHAPADTVHLLKVSQRRDLDISTVTFAIRLQITDKLITLARVAFGGVGPIATRLKTLEQNLTGNPFSPELFEQAGIDAASEVTPISDVRGTDKYRLKLVQNALPRFAHQYLAAHNADKTLSPRTSTACSLRNMQA